MNTWVKPCSFPSDLASMVRRRSTFNVPTFNGYHQPKKNCACNATVPPMIVNRQSQIGNVLLAAFCRPPSAFCSSPAPVLPSAAVLPCTLSAAICLPVFRNSQCSPCCLLVSRISPFAIRHSQCVSCCLLVFDNSPFAIRNRSCQRPPLRRSSFASPAVYGNMRAMCYEAPLLPSRTEARWPGRSCERESRRLPGLSTWGTPK